MRTSDEEEKEEEEKKKDDDDKEEIIYINDFPFNFNNVSTRNVLNTWRTSSTYKERNSFHVLEEAMKEVKE